MISDEKEKLIRLVTADKVMSKIILKKIAEERFGDMVKVIKKEIFYHKQLADRWFEMSQIDQMANIGSEVYRAIENQVKDKEFYEPAFDRVLELFDLTLADKHRQII